MSDKKRYMAGIVTTLIFHMAIFLVLGFLGGRYVKIVPGADILQVTLNAGGGKKGSGKAGSVSPVNNKKQEKTVTKTENIYENIEKKDLPEDEINRNDDWENEAEETDDSAAGNETGRSGTGNNGNDEGESNGDGSAEGDGIGEGGGVPVTPPKVAYKVLPIYPPSAKRDEITGVTYVTVYVNASGTVDSVSIAQSAGNGDLDHAAVESVYQWTFTPALDKYGVPSACEITFPVEFRLN